MNIPKHKPIRLLLAAIVFGVIASLGHAANLSDQDKKFLTSYEKIHIALAADDLAGAKAAATELGDSGTDIAKAKSLQEARSAFEKLSGRAKTMIAGQSSYYVAHCPKKCITSGLPVGLKADDGKTYLLIGEHKPLNSELAQYAAKKITVEGKVTSRDGVYMIENAVIQK